MQQKQTKVGDNSATTLLRIRQRLITNPPLVNFEKTIPYRKGFAIDVPMTSGIYLVHDIRGVLYIGQSDNLRRRFDEHFWEKDNPLLAKAVAHPVGEVYFSFLNVDVSKLNSVERQLIRSFYPLCNRLFYHSN